MKKNVDNLNFVPLKKANQRILGTPDYMAPEILKGQGIMDKAIDWWSVGIMLFEMMIGFYFIFF